MGEEEPSVEPKARTEGGDCFAMFVGLLVTRKVTIVGKSDIAHCAFEAIEFRLQLAVVLL